MSVVLRLWGVKALGGGLKIWGFEALEVWGLRLCRSGVLRLWGSVGLGVWRSGSLDV